MFDPHIFFGPFFLACFQCLFTLVILLGLAKTSWFLPTFAVADEELIWKYYHPARYAELHNAQTALDLLIKARLDKDTLFTGSRYKISEVVTYRAEDMPDTRRACAWLEQKGSRAPVSLVIKEINWPSVPSRPHVYQEYSYQLHNGSLARSYGDMNIQQSIELTEKLTQIVRLIPLPLQ